MTNPEMQPVEPEGERWLRLIDFEEKIGTYLADQYRIDGQPVKVEDFMLLYPPSEKPPTVRKLFEALERMPVDDDRREELKQTLREGIVPFLGDTPTDQVSER